jgi:hypothetical protein
VPRVYEAGWLIYILTPSRPPAGGVLPLERWRNRSTHDLNKISNFELPELIIDYWILIIDYWILNIDY